MQVLRNTIGIAYPAIDEQCLLNILLPVDKQGIDALEEQAELILDSEIRTQALRTDLASALVGSIQNWESQSSDSTSS